MSKPHPRRGQVPKLELAEREAEVAALAKEGLSCRQIAARVGYADQSGAARAIRRILARIRGAAEVDAKVYQQRLVTDLDEAREQLFEVAEDTVDERVRVRALAAITNNAVATGHATGAIKLPPPVQVTNNNTQNAVDVSKLPIEDVATVRRLLYGAPGQPKALERTQEPKAEEYAQQGATSAEEKA